MAKQLTITRLGTRELWDQFRARPMDIYRETAKRMEETGMEDAPTLSRVLEALSPSEKGDKLDAFGRLLREAGIRTRSDPEAGIWASPANLFWDSAANRALYTEFFAREWRKISFAKNRQEQRAILLSGDSVVNTWDRPFADSAAAVWNNQIEPAIPLSEVVAMTTPINGIDYRSAYITYDATQLRRFRVGESAEIPIATLTTSERTIRLKKYARGLRASYEELRRLRVDKLAWYIRLAAVQSEVDKVAAVIDVMVNGDGNNGTAATVYQLADLDPDADDALTPRAWISFKMKFVQPYVLTTALMTETEALDLALLNLGNFNILLATLNVAGLGNTLTPINRFADTVRYGWTSDAPSGQIVAFDNRFAVERITEIGGDISEMDRFITNQTQVMTMSEVEGYAILDPAAVKILDPHAYGG